MSASYPLKLTGKKGKTFVSLKTDPKIRKQEFFWTCLMQVYRVRARVNRGIN